MAFTFFLSFAAAASATAQEAGSGVAQGGLSRRYTITAGFGNAMGWYGAQVERYFGHERLSAFAGIGFTPARNEGDSSGATVAMGFRAFTPGERHRGLVEVSFSQLAVWGVVGMDERGALTFRNGREYGPGVQVGYQFAGFGGFTALVSAGTGYARNADLVDAWHFMANIGFGYTWRRAGDRSDDD